MANKRPIFTENFSTNLTAIQEFLGDEGAKVFKRLLTRLVDEVVPMLGRFPQSGRRFLAHALRSSETIMLVKKLRRQLESSDELREFIVDDYLILYLVRDEQVIFLAIKHHRQLSFDFIEFWQD